MDDALVAYHLPTSGFNFSQQVSSLTQTISLSHKKFQDFETFFPLLKEHLLGIPSSELVPLETSRKSLQKCGVRIPLSDPIDPVQWKVVFIPPKEVEIVGSWSLKNGVTPSRKHPHAIIDLLVQIPLGVLQEKDYQSNRYFHKRAHYLANISKSLLKSPFSENYEFSYSFLEGDSFKPILNIRPPKDSKSASNWTARLILSYPQSVFPLAKLAPSKDNLKSTLNASPDYNQSILMDSSELNLKHHTFFTQLSVKSPAFNQTCQLVKAWAQRKVFYKQAKSTQVDHCLLGFSRFGWFVNFLVAHVLIGNREGGQKANIGGTILQTDPAALWKHVIDWLSKWNPESIVRMKAMEDTHPLCAAAQRTASLLKSDKDVFGAVFSRPSSSFASSFDNHFVIRISDEDIQRLCHEEERRTLHATLQVLSTNLQLALGKRVVGFALLRQLPETSLKFEKTRSKTTRLTPNESTILQLGLVLDPAHAFNLVTYGPSPDSSPLELEKFCKFWGDRSDLRRFQDGSIKQCVNWEVRNPLERMQIIKQIIRWVLIEKLKFKDDRRVVWDLIGDFDDFIQENPTQLSKIYEKDPKELGFTHVMKIFNEFTKELKTLKENGLIPLSITSVQPDSEYLRYSSVFVPGPRRLKHYANQPLTTKYLPSLLCQLKFESSGKWPESLEAIQKIKAALLVKIAEGLVQSEKVVECTMVFDHKVLPICQNVTLDVLHSSGHAFKLMVCYEREEMLLEEALAIDSNDPREAPECKTSWIVEALAYYRKTFVYSRKHHDAIAALQTRFPSFTYTVRLIKRWFSTHMLLSTHISVELVELLTSVVYLLPEDALPPTTGSSGFIRFLRFLKCWDWKKQPLMIPLQSSIGLPTNGLTHFPVESVKAAQQSFQATRKKDPGFHRYTYFVATEDDLEGSRWLLSPRGDPEASRTAVSILRPTRLISDRLQALASASLEVLEPSIELGSVSFQPKTIFKSPLTHFDFHLLLDLSCSTRLHQSVDRVCPDSVSSASALETRPQIDDDPVLEFFEALQHTYRDSIEFFYDQFGGPLIGGVVDQRILAGGSKSSKRRQSGDLAKPLDEASVSVHPTNTTANPSKMSAGGGGGANADGRRRKAAFDLDACLAEICDGIGQGLVAKVLKKGVDY
ncbi:hypothetical protein PTTG_00743 [Puccinia triticina 1-1 BBBD Race 1]|uniref:U3 small nucleolar RNA-associated protein 22 n=2 Tax=Puccinia triticina TaxID=208348 RepID=A0A0C4EJ26_PUCT1|nr:uncharacterized protein PtA15_2A882 [Puccinia triticina]OAV92597.1 hypothetical protein PTTG_00743 [Puccinia triticina 1-1 BBBD Race 1]WAQ82565.1 hypothetical protein PtA15_2A882 [Puccinia triticina]